MKSLLLSGNNNKRTRSATYAIELLRSVQHCLLGFSMLHGHVRAFPFIMSVSGYDLSVVVSVLRTCRRANADDK